MSAVDLLQPILEGGLQRNNFFNGRLLSAEDLRAEQDAAREQDHHLARAIGDGVAWGLRVSVVSAGAENPRVLVREGLALNRRGDLLSLSDDAEVTLLADRSEEETAAGLFGECEPPRATASLSGEGAYVLVIAPASGYRGTAPVSDPNTTAVGRGACGARYRVEGVRFRLVPMPIGTSLDGVDPVLRGRAHGLLPSTGDPARERLRNLLAHLCFGTQVVDAGGTTDTLRISGGASAPTGWGVLDALRARRDLTDCDVPLAVVVLTSAGIRFVDLWSARRRPVDAEAIDAWTAVAGPRRLAEGEAAFLHFQSQLAIVQGMPSPSTIAASTYFDVLPAAGWLPTGTGGFSWATFLGAHAPPAVTPVDAALLRGILQRSWFHEPFVLTTSPPVPLRVYEVPNAPYVVFARSSRGSLRVILSPAPAPSVAVEVVATAQTGPVARATTRSGGTVPIPELVPGQHTVTVTAAGFMAAESAAAVVGGRTTSVQITLTPQPPQTGTIDGRVRAAGVALPGAEVALPTANRGTLTGGDGRFRFTNVPAGAHTLVIRLSGFLQATRAVTLLAGATVDLDIELTPEPSGAISGRVMEVTGAPISGVQLSVVGTEIQTTSSSQGQYELTSVPAGMRLLHAQRSGYVTQTQAVTVVQGQTVNRTIVLTPLQTGVGINVGEIVARARDVVSGVIGTIRGGAVSGPARAAGTVVTAGRQALGGLIGRVGSAITRRDR
jgi:hypothetical protein